ncbi:Protein tyrosine kinase, partial [Rhizoctonia solani]
MSPLRSVSTPNAGTESGADTPMHSPSPLRQRILLDPEPRFAHVVHRPAFPNMASPRRSSLDFSTAVGSPGPQPFPQRRPLTRLSSDTTFAQPLVPLSDSDSDGSDLELDIEGDAVIRGFGIDDDVEIHDADPEDGQDLSILEGQEDDEADQSWHTATPFTPGNSFFSNVLSPNNNDLPARPNLTRTPSSRPTILEELQPPKAKRRSMDHALTAGAMSKLLLTPSRSRHREPAPERSSPPETASPASPTRKFRLGLPLPPRSHGAENYSWHGGIDMSSESIRKLSLIDDEYNPGSDPDSPSKMFPNATTIAAKGKGRRDPSWDARKLKSLKPLRRGIFAPSADSTNTEIPIIESVPSTDPSSPFVQQSTTSNAPKDFVAPTFSLSVFSPPRTSSPMKAGQKGAGLFEKEMNLSGVDGEETDMFPPISASSPPPVGRRGSAFALGPPAPQLHPGNATFSGVSSLLSGPLKKKFKGGAAGDDSVQLEEGIQLTSSAKPRTRARTMSFGRGNLPNIGTDIKLEQVDELVTPRFAPATSSWPDDEDMDFDKSIFDSMVQHTSFSVDAGGSRSLIPDTPVKKAVFGQTPGDPIAMGDRTKGWMTSLPDRGGKAFGTRAPRPSLPIRFPDFSPSTPDDSPAAGRSKVLNLEVQASPTMRWGPLAEESPSLRPHRKAGENRPRRRSNAGDISLNLRSSAVNDTRKSSLGDLGPRKGAPGENSLGLRKLDVGVKKAEKSKSPKRAPVGQQKRTYGSLGVGRPGVRDGIPEFLIEGENEDEDAGMSTDTGKEKGGLGTSASAGSFLPSRPNSSHSGPLFMAATPNFLNVGPDSFMRRPSFDTVSGSDGEASVAGTPTRRGLGARRGGVQPRQSLAAAATRSAQPVAGRQLPFVPSKGLPPLAALKAGHRSSLPVANWRLVTPSPSLSSLASLMDTPTAPARRSAARASPILSKCRRPAQTPTQSHLAEIDPEPMAALGRLEREYTTVQQIGKGTFGQVLKVEKDGRLFAVKRSKQFEGVRHRRRVLEEVDVLRHLANPGHPNVLQFEDAWEQDGRSLMLTEMCELGNLADFLMEWGEKYERLDEARVWKIASDLSHGLAFIHHMGVIHLDLKPANMFVTIEGRIRIGDFGMASRWPRIPSEADSSDGFEREGDRDYMAPEILQGVYGFEADVFSLGMTLLECAGNIIVPAMGEPWHKLRNDDLSDVELDGFSPEIVDFIATMMRRDASQRPTMKDACDHGCITRTHTLMMRAIENAKKPGTGPTDVFRASPFGSEGPAFLEEVLGRANDGMDTS